MPPRVLVWYMWFSKPSPGLGRLRVVGLASQWSFIVFGFSTLNIKPIELSVKSFKERRNRGFEHVLRKLSIKRSLAHCVLELSLKVGWSFWNLLFPTLELWGCFETGIGHAHGTHCPKVRIKHVQNSYMQPFTRVFFWFEETTCICHVSHDLQEFILDWQVTLHH